MHFDHCEIVHVECINVIVNKECYITVVRIFIERDALRIISFAITILKYLTGNMYKI